MEDTEIDTTSEVEAENDGASVEEETVEEDTPTEEVEAEESQSDEE